jgi:hypothetical protein
MTLLLLKPNLGYFWGEVGFLKGEAEDLSIIWFILL